TAARRRGMAKTEVFGLRMQRESFSFFMEQLALLVPGPLTDVERIEAVFGPTTFIHLTRTDRVDQAISLLRAEQTGLWHRNFDGSEFERTAPPSQPRYDADAIGRHIEHLGALDRSWVQWFERQEIAHLRITYEALAEDPRGVLSEVLKGIGGDPTSAGSVSIPTAKLADEESHAWKRRFVSERSVS
ncbi:MAG: Stf0 family sulfotransferase, partial [Pseudomonadota bacterium]